MWANYLSPELLQRYQVQIPQNQGNGLSTQNLTNKGYSPGILQKVGNILPGIVGLKDIDYPMFKGVINITNGRAEIIDTMSLDTKKGSGDKDAQAMGQFAVDRINQILEANGLLDNKSISGIRVNVGGASGRHQGKASGKLGKGLFVGSTGSFNEGAEHTNLASMADFGTALDQYVIGAIEGKTGGKLATIPQYDASNFTPSNSLGSYDNTSVVGRMLLNAAASIATGYGLSQLANTVGGAATAGAGATEGAVEGAVGFAGVPEGSNALTLGAPGFGSAAANTALGNAITPTFASGITAGALPATFTVPGVGSSIANAAGDFLPGVSEAGSLTGAAGSLTGSGPGVINQAISNINNSTALSALSASKTLADLLTQPSQADLLAEEQRLFDAANNEYKQGVINNTNVSGTSIGVRPSGRVLTDMSGNPVYSSRGIINQAYGGQ